MEDIMFLPPSPPPPMNSNNSYNFTNATTTSTITNGNGIYQTSSSGSSSNSKVSPYSIWEKVEIKQSIGNIPCQRSLHAGAVWKDYFVVFGGYDGHHRVNDLYSYSFKLNQWKVLGILIIYKNQV